MKKPAPRAAYSRAKWAVQAWWRARRHLGGDFAQGEASDRAADLTTKWYENWPNHPPLVADRIPVSERDSRWLRFSSLPKDKRYPDSDAERAEVLRRHTTAIRELVETYDDPGLVVILEDWNTHDAYGGWTKVHFPGCWPWLAWRDPREDPTDPFAYFWVAPMSSVDDLDGLLLLIADDTGRASITDSEMNWLYRPYDGGANLYFHSTPERDSFRQLHPDWLPTKGPGS